MLVVSDVAVARQQRALLDSCCRDNDLICRIPMKRSGQLCRLNGDFLCQRRKTDAGIGECLIEPLLQTAGKREASAFDEFCNFPAGNGTDPKPGLLVGSDQFQMVCGKAWVAVDPENPDVSVQHNQRTASQSVSATGSVGASYVTGVPRSGYPF